MGIPRDNDGDSTQPGMNVDLAYSSTDSTKIDVDITSISQFAEVLRREIDENLRPTWQQIQETLGQAGQFGLSPELDDLSAKRQEYDRYLQQAKQLFRDVIEGVYQFADGADKIAASYGRADQFAKVTAEDVNKAMPTVTRTTTSGGGNTPRAM
jgi:ABC-type transporter Mla subunit MlaD